MDPEQTQRSTHLLSWSLLGALYSVSHLSAQVVNRLVRKTGSPFQICLIVKNFSKCNPPYPGKINNKKYYSYGVMLIL